MAQTRKPRERISFEEMAARRTERLVNLVICLLATRQFLTAERIRATVPGYESADGLPETDDAFKRMFERDKNELREMGIPLEVGRNSAFDVDDGYRISRRDYELPAIEFEPDEAAAVGLAARLWQSATLGEAARGALIKLRAAGVDVQPSGTPGALPQVDASDPNLPTLLDAARTRRRVHFDYAKSGEPAPRRRTVEPWGVLSWRRRWYVAGFDRDRGEPRSFRLSRISGTVTPFGRAGDYERPEKPDLFGMVAGAGPDEERFATVRVAAAGAGELRRLAASEVDSALTISYTDLNWLARRVAAAGKAATVLDPPELRTAVAALLRSAAGTR
jgi:proteasome accessory factor B